MRPTEVKTQADGSPKALLWRNTMQPVRKVISTWHQDLPWVSGDSGRDYYLVELHDGTRIKLFRRRTSDNYTIVSAGTPRSWLWQRLRT